MSSSRRLHTSAHHVRFVRAKEGGDWSSETGKQKIFRRNQADTSFDAAEAYREVLSTVRSEDEPKHTSRELKAKHNGRHESKQPPPPIKSTVVPKPAESTEQIRARQRRKEMGLLRAAQEGDLPQIIQYIDQESVDVNACDDFGWSPLMCAAGAGQSEAVTELLQRGADWRLADGKGRDARALAAAIGRHDVAEIINLFARPRRKEKAAKAGAHVDDSQDAVIRCDQCGVDIPVRDWRSHAHGTLHNFSEQREALHFTNSALLGSKGYHMMRKAGWDDGQGLGVDASGIKNPVKTVLKRDREGLGVRPIAKQARVTHFAPYDATAVQDKRRKEVKPALTRRDIDRRDKLEKRKERNLRSALS